MIVFRRTFITSINLQKRSGYGRKSLPGLQRQISVHDEVDVVDEIERNPEGFGDLESDLLNVHKTHKRFEQELEDHKDRIRKFVVKSKYFRDAKLPNFLTYAEKQQIKHLHESDSEQWTVEALSESFPANCEIIKKIIKSRWKPFSIKSHDASVFRNWELFKKGSIKVPADLEVHLKKFCHRNVQHSPNVASFEKHVNAPSSTEFSSIVKISSQSKRSDGPKVLPLCSGNDEDTVLLGKVLDKKYMRFTDLKKNRSETEGTDVIGMNGVEQTSSSSLPNPTVTADNFSLRLSESFLNEIEISNEDRKRFEVSRVKDRIHIPRKIFRKGSIYRVDDSYYDDDGEFLYRVPGMTEI
uniref:Uncharacterized protein n=1 Tax=Stomoxys calcitrans TaxID=35570 RepID=A0A1I8PP10_STOCA